MSKYSKLGEQINKLDKEIEETEQGITETRNRVDSSQETLDQLWLSLKHQVLEGEETSIHAVEGAIAQAKKFAARDKALLEGLNEKLPALRQKRQTLVNEQTEIIALNGDKWFTKEIEQYEQAREQLLSIVRRLTACSTILHSCGEHGRAVSAAHLGKSWSHLRVTKLPSIKNFSAARYVDGMPSPDLVSTPQERAEVKNELTN